MSKKKTIPFDITKMNPDFSNVVYRDGTKPLFVCARQDSIYGILSVIEHGTGNSHRENGSFNAGEKHPKDLLLEVEQKYPSLEELTEEYKQVITEFCYWYYNTDARNTESIIAQGFDKVYTNFLNSQEK